MKKVILMCLLGVSINLAYGEGCPFSQSMAAQPLNILPCFIPGYEKNGKDFSVWMGEGFQIPGSTESGDVTLKLQAGSEVDQEIPVSYSYFTGCSTLQFQQHISSINLAGPNSTGQITFSTDCTFAAVQELQKKYPNGNIDPNLYGAIGVGVKMNGAIPNPVKYQVTIYQ